MGKKLIKEEFIEKVLDKFPENKKHYCYDDVVYKGNRIKIKIFCKVCNEYFEQEPRHHSNGHGCPKCGIKKQSKNSTKTKEYFEQKARGVHGDDYEYVGKYINTKTKIKIFCKKCKKYFWQNPTNHLMGKGCPRCANKIKSKNMTKTHEYFEKLAREVHGDDYEYPDKYINSRTKIEIFCKKCGKYFWQKPNNHLMGKGCFECGRKKAKKKITKTKEWFEKKSKGVHGDDYEYPDKYIHSNKKMRILCKKCQDFFEQTPHSHLSGSGCPRCKNSKGEKRIDKILNEKQIEYIPQKRFKKCKDKYTLPFDFYISELNLCIEYQGEQHYKIVDFSKGKLTLEELQEQFKNVKKRDNIKRKFCKENNINLLEISYKDFKNIKKIIEREVINKL